METTARTNRAPIRRTVLAAAAVLGTWVVVLALAPAGWATESLFFGFNNSGTSSGVGRIGVDGSGLREDIAPGVPTPGVQEGIAATSTHVYFVVAIGMGTSRPVYRANADGTGTPALFFTPCSISGTYQNAVTSLATDGQYLYYVCRDMPSINARIGRIGLDGSGQNDEFINPGSGSMGPRVPTHITANSTHLYFTTGTDIHRATSTTPVTVTNISAGGNPGGIAVNATHVYWTVGGGSPKISRAALDLSGPADVVTGLTTPGGIAVTDTAIYWRRGLNDIAKASIAGAIESPSFVGASSRGTIQSLAVAAAAPAPTPTPTPTGSTTTPAAAAPAPTVKTSGLKALTPLKRTGPRLTAAVDCTTTNAATLTSCTVELVVPSSTLKQGKAAKGKTTVIGRATKASATGAATIAVTVGITNKAAKRILSTNGRLRATVRITATSIAGQAGTANRATMLVAPAKAAKAAFRR